MARVSIWACGRAGAVFVPMYWKRYGGAAVAAHRVRGAFPSYSGCVESSGGLVGSEWPEIRGQAVRFRKGRMSAAAEGRSR